MRILAILFLFASQAQAQITASAVVTSTGITFTYDTTGVDFSRACNVYVRDLDVQNMGFYCSAAYCPHQTGTTVVDVRGVMEAYYAIPPNTVTVCGCNVYTINPFTNVHHYRLYAQMRNGELRTKDITVDTIQPQQPTVSSKPRGKSGK